MWDRLDLLFFAGYALWSYLTFPWNLALPGVTARELEPAELDGTPARRLEVDFPLQLPAHSCRQCFHFDGALRLVRLDYDPEAFSPRARAAQRCRNYRWFDGFAFPTERRVVPRTRGGGARRGPTLVRVVLHSVRLRRTAAAPLIRPDLVPGVGREETARSG